jgi:hypothetical protein
MSRTVYVIPPHIPLLALPIGIVTLPGSVIVHIGSDGQEFGK